MAAEFLRDNGFSAAPVVDEDGNLVGVVTRSALAAPPGANRPAWPVGCAPGMPLLPPFRT